MKCAGEGNNARSACGGAGNFYRVFHCFSAGREKGRFGFSRHRGNRVDALRQGHKAGVRDNLKGGMRELIELFADSIDNFWVAMAGIEPAIPGK